MYQCVPKGVCAKQMSFDVQEGKLHSVSFTGGCPGNLEALSRLFEDMPIETVIEKCKGIRCGNKPTSCPDQLAAILENLQNGIEPEAPAPQPFGGLGGLGLKHL